MKDRIIERLGSEAQHRITKSQQLLQDLAGARALIENVNGQWLAAARCLRLAAKICEQTAVEELAAQRATGEPRRIRKA